LTHSEKAYLKAFTSAPPLLHAVNCSRLAAGTNDGGAFDVAVMDDFLYAEPQAGPTASAVPEPGSVFLLGSGLAGAYRWRQRRKGL
jgi:hypothetical protein